jgi:methylglutamate dehydrogenase subunit D
MARAAQKKSPVFLRQSPLQGVAMQGRFGLGTGPAGVTFTVRHPLSLAMVIARKGKAKPTQAVLDGMKAVTVMWAGPDQHYVQAEGPGEGALVSMLATKLEGLASVSDQSHGRVTIRIAGPMARTTLAKGMPVDLHADVFPVGKSALTQMHHVGVHLTRVDNDAFEISVFRGFAESLWEFLVSQAAEFGYLVR